MLQHLKFSNFTTVQHNTTPRSGRITFTDQETTPGHQLERRPSSVDWNYHRTTYSPDTPQLLHLHTTPRSYAALLSPSKSEGQANGEGTKGGGRGADQGSPKTTISPSTLMEPSLKAHPGSHVPPSNAVQGEETSQGNGGIVETPTRHNI